MKNLINCIVTAFLYCHTIILVLHKTTIIIILRCKYSSLKSVKYLCAQFNEQQRCWLVFLSLYEYSFLACNLDAISRATVSKQKKSHPCFESKYNGSVTASFCFLKQRQRQHSRKRVFMAIFGSAAGAAIRSTERGWAMGHEIAAYKLITLCVGNRVYYIYYDYPGLFYDFWKVAYSYFFVVFLQFHLYYAIKKYIFYV